jgi:hypothetical protein
MAANGWTNVLKMTINKSSSGAPSAVNLYPQGLDFNGNYALRFNMYLSIYSFAIDNPNAGTFPREFALFGINHRGTNCNWRPAVPIPAGSSSTTNADGVWFAIGADTGSITPADYDAFTSPALPNAGVTADLVSNTGASQSGVFKRPPFVGRTATGGTPVNQWVDVSVEVTRQTNVTILINRAQVLASFSITNGGNYTNGTFLLGYLDPVFNVSDNSAFVYYSNVRVVELSPYILGQPTLTNSLANNVIVTQFSTLALNSSATLASAPITNVWYRGTGAFNSPNTGVPTAALQTNSINATDMTDTLTWTFNSALDGTNYMSVFSDAAGSVTSRVVAVEVVLGPTNQTAIAGSTFQFQVRAAGPSAPTSYQWRFDGTNLVNGAKYAGVTSSNLFITNIVAGDAGTYSVAVVNPAGTVTPSAVLTVPGGSSAPPTFENISLVNADAVLSFSTTNVNDSASSFVLQSSPVVEGPYTNTPASFTGSGGMFQVTVPQGSSNMFYRLRRTD